VVKGEKIMKYALLFLVALLAGVAGGCLSTYALLARKLHHPEEQVIRAHRFELVNDAGRPISFWGFDKSQEAVLAFGSNDAPGAPGGSSQRHSSLGLNDPYGSRVAIGVPGNAGPFLRFNGSDGQLRVLLDMDDFERPSLMMKDDNLLGLTLGSERSDTPDFRDKTEHWALNFFPEERARIGMFTEQKGKQTYVTGFVTTNPYKRKYPH
jgi:hypothetical protein